MVALAHSQALSSTTFFACEDSVGNVDSLSITQDDTLDCATGHGIFTTTVHWSATGPQGIQGIQGLKGDVGAIGDTGPVGLTGPAGVPFIHAPCTETGLTGSAQQENALFCLSGIEADGGFAYLAAIAAAKNRIIVGTPLFSGPANDWSNVAITYVELSSGFHMEYHADHKVRIYNSSNQQVF
jgi:hypothetical protein